MIILQKLNYQTETPEKRTLIDKITSKLLSDGRNFDDFVFSVGGDGTMMHTMQKTILDEKKIVGINAGNVGFLTPYSVSDVFTNLLDKIYDKDYRVEKRSVLVANFEDPTIAINDFAITGLTANSVIDFSIEVDHLGVISKAGRYKANSTVISGPCGSTAYNMNTGGAIVDPVMKCMQLTLVAPMTIGTRPLIFSKNSKVIITLHSKHQIYVDGQLLSYAPDQIEISLFPIESQIIVPKDWNFYSALATKLHWNNGAAV